MDSFTSALCQKSTPKSGNLAWGENPIARASVSGVSSGDEKRKIVPTWKVHWCAAHLRDWQSFFTQGQFGIRAHTKSIRGCLQPRSPIIAETNPCGCQKRPQGYSNQNFKWGKHPIAPDRLLRLSSQDLMHSNHQDEHLPVTLVAQRDEQFSQAILNSVVAHIAARNYLRAPSAPNI